MALRFFSGGALLRARAFHWWRLQVEAQNLYRFTTAVFGCSYIARLSRKLRALVAGRVIAW